MKKDRTLLLGVIFGLGIGVILFALRLAGIYSGSSVPVCLGLLVLVLDIICMIPVFNDFKNKKVMSSGVRTDAYISQIEKAAISPKYYTKDESGRLIVPNYSPDIPVAYSLELKFSAGGTEQAVKLATPPVCGRDIVPYGIYEGARIPIKYIEKDPQWVMIDIPAVSQPTIEAQRSLMYKGPFTAFIMTTIYIVYVIMKVL